MGLSDRDYQKRNYDRVTGNVPRSNDPVYYGRSSSEPDLSNTSFNSSTGELEIPTEKIQSSSKKSSENPIQRSRNSKNAIKEENDNSHIVAAFIGLAVMIILFVKYALSDDEISASTPTPTYTSPSITVPTPTVSVSGITPEQSSLPPTSVMHSYYPISQNMPPFSFSVPLGNTHYFFKLRNISNNQIILSGFCRAGDTFKTTVPLGDYHLDWASGMNWKNETELFGTYTVLRRADTPINFYRNGSQLMGYTVTMSQTPDGNLRSSYIPQSGF